MVGEWLILPEEHGLARGIALVRVFGGDCEAAQDAVAVLIGIVDVKDAILDVVWVEGETKQSLLVLLGADAVPQIEEWLVAERAVGHDHDSSRLLQHEETVRPVRWGRDPEWTVETAHDRFERHAGLDQDVAGLGAC
jgi:hypothetical protein